MNDADRQRPLYTISTVAKLLDVHPQTLRLYEREGLVKPQRSTGNTRLYSEEDIGQLRVILNLTRELGVNLAGVEVILQMRLRMERMQDEMEALLRFVRDELSHDYQDVGDKFRQAVVRAPYQGLVKIENIERTPVAAVDETRGVANDEGEKERG